MIRPPSGHRPARTNPFRSKRIERLRFRLSDEGWHRLWERLFKQACRGALVGPHGSGKTTLLEEIESHLEDRGWSVRRWRLSSERPRPTSDDWQNARSCGPSDVLSVDGAEQLSWWRRRRLKSVSRTAGGLLITCHCPGFVPTLHEHRTAPDLLRDLVAELLGANLSPELEARLPQIFAAHGGNIRGCLRTLYDRWPEL